ncbi:uncharacterized protein LOC118279783 [Spodoptera frugiperda]|uniref:Uncharacterized protein LOC118279783 n=1 Tax=Spodoptera frugiperda TaxID=7108 RepID=A0A9R0DIM0_SPOFR|nr:uncharacterized protein LOC118279783 [Spodoptera frugiperda]
MEDVYTIKVKTKPDTRNLYPSERRYSASTVSGLAWVHIALAATSFLLACLALVSPNSNVHPSNNITQENTILQSENTPILLQNENTNGSLYENDFDNETQLNSVNETNLNSSVNGNPLNTNGTTTEFNGNETDSNYILVLAPALITVFGLAAGVASILASVRWYIDHNITWLFVISCLSSLISLTSFIMITVWFITTSDGDITEFYKDKVPFKDYFVVKHSDIITKNESHMIVALNTRTEPEETPNLFTKRVLSINILIAAFLELLWSILSVKIAYKGMKNTYKDDNERRGNCISVVTKIKGNDTRKMPRNGKLLPPKPDLIDHYPSKKIKRIFLAQSENGFYLKNEGNKAKQNTETSSEFYKERMMNFLNRCASLEGMSNIENTSSVHSDALNPIPEGITVEAASPEPLPELKDRMTPVSWGDSPDHTIYNQNTLNLDKIFKFKPTQNKSECDNE